MTATTFLEGKQVILRGLRREDLEDYRSWMDNPVATELMETGWRPVSDSELESIYQASTEANDSAVFVMVDKKTKKPVGVCGLYLIQWICRRAEFRILVGKDEARGKGLGTEAANLVVAYAFDKLNMEVVNLGVNVENKGAIRSYERAGFKHEGIRRKLVYRNGRYYDCLMMSIVREEFYGDSK